MTFEKGLLVFEVDQELPPTLGDGRTFGPFNEMAAACILNEKPFSGGMLERVGFKKARNRTRDTWLYAFKEGSLK